MSGGRTAKRRAPRVCRHWCRHPPTQAVVCLRGSPAWLASCFGHQCGRCPLDFQVGETTATTVPRGRFGAMISSALGLGYGHHRRATWVFGIKSTKERQRNYSDGSATSAAVLRASKIGLRSHYRSGHGHLGVAWGMGTRLACTTSCAHNGSRIDRAIPLARARLNPNHLQLSDSSPDSLRVMSVVGAATDPPGAVHRQKREPDVT